MADDLYRRAKTIAAQCSRKFKALVEEWPRSLRGAPRKAPRPRDLAGLAKHARGVVDSGVPDLASDSRHLVGFGRDAGRH